MAKRLIFCFDGTWNKIDSEHPTNVARIAQSVSRFDDQGTPQIIYYDEGVGTSATDRWTGGILGRGLQEKIIEAYHFLVLNYEPGDELYVFGFSRGAFTARSFVGLIRNCSIISRRSLTHIREAVDLYISSRDDNSPNSERARLFRFQHAPRLCLPGDLPWREAGYPDMSHEGLTALHVEYLGVWDTVGALGIPAHLKLLTIFNRKYRFHNTELSSFVRRARHAVAVDERRRSFEPALWSNLDDLNNATPGERRYEQQLFPGVHGAVGGGGPVRGLSDAALEWVFHGARDAGLVFDLDDQSLVFLIHPDHRAQLFNETGKKGWSIKDLLTGVGLADRRFPSFDRLSFHPSLARRFGEPAGRLPEQLDYRPPSLRELFDTLSRMAAEFVADLSQEAIEIKSGGDDRMLCAPTSVRRYTVKRGDTLESVAAQQMGSAGDRDVLAYHNKTVGLLFEDERLYAGSEIEIPAYATGPLPSPHKPVKEAAEPAPATPPQPVGPPL